MHIARYIIIDNELLRRNSGIALLFYNFFYYFLIVVNLICRNIRIDQYTIVFVRNFRFWSNIEKKLAEAPRRFSKIVLFLRFMKHMPFSQEALSFFSILRAHY